MLAFFFFFFLPGRSKYERRAEGLLREVTSKRQPLLAASKMYMETLPFFHDAESTARKARETVFQDYLNPTMTPLLKEFMEDPNDKLFNRVIQPIRNAIIRDRSANPLRLYLCLYWTEHSLWLMTDPAAVLYIQKVFGHTVSEDAYEKARKRLGLKKHPDSPLSAKAIPSIPDKLSKVMSV
jgi:hypothetical protein